MRKLNNEEIWGDRVLNVVKKQMEKVTDPFIFSKTSQISLRDCLMSCFAVFNLKWPSLLQYNKNMQDETLKDNLCTLYHVKQPPSDSYMRERLDELDPTTLAPIYKKLFALLQKNKVLENYQYLDGHYLISMDGTGHFSSTTVHCPNCCVKNHRDGHKTYYHQLLGAVLLHPDQEAVIPFYPEAIKKEDGDKKNDCERNAAKRLFARLRLEHPHLKMIIIEDGLASNAPHIQELDRHKMKYILGAKEGDHKFLFNWVKHAETTEYSYTDDQGTQHNFEYVNKIPLNDSNFELKVNFLKYEEINPKGKKKTFSWVTNIPVSNDNITKIMRGGRARWAIENEMFNTLKNQGYEFEHNDGHGKKNLCTVMAVLMLLAFLVDQVQLQCCNLYKRAKKKAVTFKSLWERMRAILTLVSIKSYKELYGCIVQDIRLNTS